MSRTDLQTLINRARKAGLNARELYSALSARSDETGEPTPGQTDCNGYVVGRDARGQRVYLPRGDQRRA
jgi:hypothetical protein